MSVKKWKINKYLFVILSLTWGIPMTLIGFVFYLYNLMTRQLKAVSIIEGRVVSTIKADIGGVSLGMFTYVGYDNYQSTHRHELGHTIQHVIWGPLFLFVIGIPSIIRAGLWNKIKKKHPYKKYDDIWFEGQATRFGEKYFSDYRDINIRISKGQ